MSLMLALTYVAAACICVGVLLAVHNVSRRMTEAYQEQQAEIGAKGASERTLRRFGAGMQATIGAFFSESEIALVERQLVLAGRPYGGITAAEFLAASLGMALISGLVLGVLSWVFLGGDLTSILFAAPIGVFGVIVIYAMMRSEVTGKVRLVSSSISDEFPYFLDLAQLVVQAGGTQTLAVDTYLQSAKQSPLTQELRVLRVEAQQFGFSQGLTRMADRVENEQVRMILRNLAQAERSTGKVSDYYRQQAEALRDLRAEMAERAAERIRANVKLPEFLMVAAISIVMLGPAIVQIMSSDMF